jgi:intracellular multiplication protein IcmB
MLDKMISATTSLMGFAGHALKRHPGDYCDLETVDSDVVLVSKRGALASVINVSGIKQLMGPNTIWQQVVALLAESLSSQFDTKGHALQVVFEQDPDRTAEELELIQDPVRKTCDRLHMDLKNLLDTRTESLSAWTTAERMFLVVWTLPEVLSKSERKAEGERAKKALSGKISSVMAQNPLAATAMLRNRHHAMTNTLVSEMAAAGVTSTLMDVRSALRMIRSSMDPGFTGPDWSPCLPGDRVLPAQRQERPDDEVWDTLWPTLGSQLAPRDAELVGPNQVAIGNRVYEPIYFNLFPQSPDFFSSLFGRVREKHLPWRISFLIEGGGLSSFGFKAGIAQVLSFVSSENKLIKRAKEDLESLQNEGVRVVQARIAACTWAPRGDLALLSARASGLSTAMAAWGAADVSEVTGDPMAGVASTIPAFTQGSVGTKTAAPLDEILAMMPWGRPSSPWSEGAVTFRSPDGKLMPYQPYSDKQSTWISLIFARPGSGKSVLMNLCNLALTIAPGSIRLPRIAIIDIGPSSGGLISLIRESLPMSERHLVVHRRLRMVASDSINPFDTQLGCRYPVPSEISFLRNLLTLLVTDFNSTVPDKGMPNLAAAVVEEMYKMRSDKADATRYSPGLVREVDEAVRRCGLLVDGRSTWWEVVDGLIVAREFRPAALAQRQAVPLLPDAVQAAQSERIRSTFENIQVEGTGENLIDSFCRMVGDALALYSIMARPTAFDVSDARIVALDLDEVAKAGGPVADRQTAVMYMLARQVLAKDFYLSKDVVSGMPAPPDMELREDCPIKEIRAHHEERVRQLLEDPKRICYDEFHRTAKAQMVRDQVLLDMREGRKWKVDIMLASQSLEDFDALMIEQATGIFVMDGGNASTIETIATKFGFSDPAEKHALQRRVHPPRAGGGTFLAKFMTTSGWYTMLLCATMGPMELWAFSTTAEDAAVRNRLYEKIGPARARKVLAYAYPGGSARTDINDRKQRMGVTGDDDGDAKGAIDQVIEDMLDLDHRMHSND